MASPPSTRRSSQTALISRVCGEGEGGDDETVGGEAGVDEGVGDGKGGDGEGVCIEGVCKEGECNKGSCEAVVECGGDEGGAAAEDSSGGRSERRRSRLCWRLSWDSKALTSSALVFAEAYN